VRPQQSENDTRQGKSRSEKAQGRHQAGVYKALHEAGIEPDWIIGTSIGAINASLIPETKHGTACRRSRICGDAWSGWSQAARSRSDPHLSDPHLGEAGSFGGVAVANIMQGARRRA
jgi:predicted acylesterase/phospholipase RssA